MDSESECLKMNPTSSLNVANELGLKGPLVKINFLTHLLEYDSNSLTYLLENESIFLTCLLKMSLKLM